MAGPQTASSSPPRKAAKKRPRKRSASSAVESTPPKTEVEEEGKPIHRMATGEMPLQSGSRSSIGDLFRTLTSGFFKIPTGFFQSQAELRTWGEEKLCDPSIQPMPAPPESTVAYPFNNPLPGYPYECHENFLLGIRNNVQYESVAPVKNVTKQKTGLNLETPWIDMHFSPSKHFRPQPLGYNWNTLPNYSLDTYPYVNAFMTPQNPMPMYGPANPFVAYPYGVPAVEENEQYDDSGVKKSTWGCC